MSNRRKKKKDEPIFIGKDFWETGTPPPASEDIEELVLGALLIEYNALNEVGTQLTPKLFYKEQNQIIAKVILEMWHDKKAIDIVTINEEFLSQGLYDQELGLHPAYIAGLTSRIASTAHLEYHVRCLQELSLKRIVTEICARTMQRIYSGSADIFEVHSDLQQQLDGALKDLLQFEIEAVGDVNREVNKEQLEAAQGGGVQGVLTGMRRLDKVTNGWQKSDLIIIAGRPSMGKTAFIVSATLEPAINLNIPVAIFSLEMSKKQLVGRMQSQISGINVSRIIKKQLSVDEAIRNDQETTILNAAPIYIDDTPSISVLELKSKARKLVREHGVEMIIIDYLQLMRSGMNIANREQEIAEISRQLKAIAKELDVPVIALAQLSRSVESRGGDKKPMLSDLRESGQIEQDADMVAFCYRPEYYGIEEYDIDGRHYYSNGLFMLIIAKHRNGSLGEIPLSFKHELARIYTHVDDSSEYNDTFVQRKLNERGELETPTGIKPNRDFEQTTVNNIEHKQEIEEAPEDDWIDGDDDDLPF